MIEGKITNANIENISKQQTRIARSSGDGELRGLDDNIKHLLNLTEEHTDDTHNTVQLLASRGVPLLEMMDDVGLHTEEKEVRLDAAVAITAACRGHSKLMQYLSKTQGVDIGWLAETLRDLNMKLVKVDSKFNLSDIHTKAVTRDVLDTILPRLGVISL